MIELGEQSISLLHHPQRQCGPKMHKKKDQSKVLLSINPIIFPAFDKCLFQVLLRWQRKTEMEEI